MSDISVELSRIQKELKVPKDLKNTFANFNYRNAEGILEKVKPLLDKATTLTLSDEMVEVGGRVYVKATAKLSMGTAEKLAEDQFIEVSGFAREQELKKGMDEAQITGSASSYARKYALSGLFLLDDGNDADSHDNSSEGSKTATDEPEDEPSKDYPATDKTKAYMNGLYKQRIGTDEKDLKQYILDQYGWTPEELTQEQASTIIDDLKAS